MTIIVCIKQVPGTTAVDIDETTGVLKRAGVAAKLNPYDLYALETALRLRSEHGGRVVALTMGPPQAEAVIREAYAMGVDDGYLLTDPAFAGSDVLATSYTLAGAVRHIGEYHLILCGRQTTDGDTAQVGSAMAEHLDIPHAAWVNSIQSVDKTSITVTQNMEHTLETVRLPFPCLITVEKDIYTPRLPSYVNLKKTADRPVTRLTHEDLLDKDEKNYGLNGSPTQVERVFPPEYETERVLWETNGDEAARRLFELLQSEKYV